VKKTELLMGMPITVEVEGDTAEKRIEGVFSYFKQVDARYSTYKSSSEISKINAGLAKSQWSAEMRHVLSLCEKTNTETGGYFDIEHAGKLDPSGLVKGWAVQQAAEQLRDSGAKVFYIEAGGDIQAFGEKPFRVGVRNPRNWDEIIKVLEITTEGVATSGSYVRGAHIYNPKTGREPDGEVISLTVVGPNIYEADRMATAAYAMGEVGLEFIASWPGLEGYAIKGDQTAMMTQGFSRYVAKS
jgi:FAD:protein FMN transferase